MAQEQMLVPQNFSFMIVSRNNEKENRIGIAGHGANLGYKD